MSDNKGTSVEAPTDDVLSTVNEEKQNFPEKIYSFLRPFSEEPKHILLSSPFARRLMIGAAGPVKPSWYCAPLASQFLQFKALTHLVDDGRKRPMPFMPFVELLQQLAPTVTPTEVFHILRKLDRDHLEELDFGEFLFVLSNNPYYDKILEATRYKLYVSKNKFNPRQRVFFSALVFYCLVQTEDDIERVYRGQKAPHCDVLKYHMDAARNDGLSELQMERRQKNVRNMVRTFKKQFSSTYTAPVPFVKATIHEEYYQTFLKRKRRLSKLLYPSELKKAARHRQIKPIEPKRQLGGPVVYETKDDYIMHLYLMASIKRPDMKIPAKMLREMRKKVFESDKLYLKELEKEALNEYYQRLREAAVIHAQHLLKQELAKGFKSNVDKVIFYDMFKDYMHLSTKSVFIFHPWTPMNIGAKYKKKPKSPPPFGKSGR